MRVWRRDWWAVWGVRMSFAAVLLVFSEFGVWEAPGEYGALRWGVIAAIYLALAAAALDVIARFRVRDIFSVLLVAGMYGLTNSLLIGHAATQDIPLSLIARPLGAHPLAFVLALAVFRQLMTGRATGPWDLLVALVAGLAWGVWVRWLPVVADEPVPAVSASDAVVVLAFGLIGSALAITLLVYGLHRAQIQAIDWLLTPREWVAIAILLGVALSAGVSEGTITEPGWGIVVALVSYGAVLLYATQSLRGPSSYVHGLIPPSMPNLPAWLIVVIPALMAGWAGYHLPGSGESSAASDILFGAVMGFGLVWLPGVSAVLGIRASVFLTRRGM